MRLDQLPKSDKIEDRRGLPVGRAGLGIGTIIILILLGWIFGIDPRVLIGGAEMISGAIRRNSNRLIPAPIRARRLTKCAVLFLLF